MKYALRYLSFLLVFTVSAQSQAQQKPSSEPALISLEEAIPAPSNCIASPLPTLIVQPNSTSLTIVGKGNMNNSWTETTDGYTIVRNTQGNYEYANKLNGELVPTGVLATNPTSRTAAEQSFLANQSKHLKPDFDPLKNAVLNQVRNQLQNKTYPTTGNIRILALLIDYPDLNNIYPKADFDSLLYGKNFRSGDGSFKYFYETASDSVLTIDVDVMGWYRASNGYLYYSNDSGYDRAADLVREAVDAAEVAGVNYANYDNDSDGDVDGIMVVHSGPGAEQGGRTQYIWSHRWVMAGGNLGAVTYDNVSINDYMMNPETRTSGSNQNLVGIGVFCHEFGHNLGLPDLYDTDDSNGDSEGIGEWCLMASGTWLGGEHLPSNFSAWCKVENGWETPTVISGTTFGNYTLNPASTTPNEIYRINTNLNNEYFLLENRQAIGLDQSLRGTGLAIFHINTNQTNSFGNRVNGDESLKGVDLEEADGLNDLDNEVNRSDAGDLFPGTSNNTAFNDASNPSALTYLATNTGIDLNNIAESSNIITFSIGNSSIQACNGGDTLTTASGTFDDGSGTANYANSLNCSWLIQPPGASSINLTFNRFDVDNTIDRVAVYDGNSFSAPLIGTYTGNSIPAAINTSGGSLYVEFTTNGSVTASGWEATYSSSGSSPTCSGTTTLTAVSGTFDDGSGSGIDYAPNLNCSWLINPPANIDNVELYFDSLDLAGGDTLFVYDGVNASAPLINSYTGANLPAFITSSGRNLFIEFNTDANLESRGWQLSYAGNNGCSGQKTFTAASGTFTDGTAATASYNNNSNCSWLIQPPGATFISLNWNRFLLEGGFDFLRVYDGSSSAATLIGTYSGATPPPTINSSGGSLFIQFTSDATVTLTGFEATYSSTTTQCLANRLLTANSGNFSDGSGTNNYQNNLNCGWLIQPPSANSITINFSAFDTEANVDSVVIYDGVDNTAPIAASFSGNTLPPSTLINGPAAFVEFITNGSGSAAGWDASYTSTSSLSCSGLTNLTAANGSFDDGSGTANYDNNLNCSWLIQPTGSPSLISLDFTTMSLSFGDFVRVYDGTSSAGTLIGTRIGTFTGGSLRAFSGAMFIEFVSNGSGTSAGWDASYSSSNTFCVLNNTFTGTSGAFADGSGSNNYANNSDCSWLIQPTAPNLQIRLNFNFFDTELNNDTVTIYDGPNSSAPILQTLSGNINPPPGVISSSGSSMFITFKSNGSVNRNGWSAFYSTQIIPACSGTTNLTANTGTFDDGSAATANYISNSNCQWLIQPPGANRIALNWNRFDTQAGRDSVIVYDGSTTSAPIIGAFSGTSLPSRVNSSGGQMLVVFRSDNFGNLSGWEATYNSTTSQCFSNLTLTNPRDTLRDGSGASNYGDNLNCSWLIQPGTAQSINLDFLSIDLLNGDSVFVYDGTSNAAPLLGAFSGNTVPATINSTGGSMFVEFITDASGGAAGWTAAYDIVSSLSCVGTTNLTAPSGSFDDGSGPANYDNNLNCSWLIQPSGNPISITLTLNNSNLGSFGDRVRIYDGNSAAGTLIGNFFFNNTGTVTAFSGSMFVVFTTDAGGVGRGWDATYNSSNSYCSPNTTFTANFGNFNDGSPFGTNYINNTDCSWLIQPTAPNVAIALNIISIDTELGTDTITVYDGATTSDPILGTFSGNTTPPAVTSTGGNMLVTFKSDAANTGQGFRANYRTQTRPFCSGQTNLTAANGTFDDGSGVGIQYVENSNCRWLIQPAGAVSINLNFNYFNTQSGGDFVNIYDGTTTSAPLIGSFSGTTTPPAVSSGGSMLVEFTSNAFFEAVGFEAQYTSSTTVNLSIAEDTIFVGSGIGNSGSFDVNSNTDWTISENANWLLTTTINGRQNQTVSAITTAPNFGPPRSEFVFATNTASGTKDSVLVIQSGSGNYAIANPDTLFYPQTGGQRKFEVLASVNWNVSSPNAPATSTISPNTGNGDDSVAITLPPNLTNNIQVYAAVLNSTAPNTSNDTVFLVQDSLPSRPPSLSSTPDTVTLNQAANSMGNFTINSTVVWQTSTPAAWLDILNPQRMSDTNLVQVMSNSMNVSTTDRFTVVAIQDIGGTLFDTVVVRQLGGTLLLDVSPKNLNLAQAANSSANANLSSNLMWNATSGDPSWLNVSPSSGNGNANLTVSATTENTSISPRASFIALASVNGNVTDTIFVTQDGLTPTLSVTPNNLSLNQAASSSGNFTVNSNTSWQTMAGATWLTVVDPNPTSDTGVVQVIANTANTNPNARSSYVSIMDLAGNLTDTVWVDQLGNSPTLNALNDTVTLASSANSTVSLSLSSNLSWNSSNGAVWFTANPSNGTNSQNITLTANSDNTTGNSRFSFLAFAEAGGNLTDTVIVVQAAQSAGIQTSPDTLRLAAAANSSGSFSLDAPSSTFSWVSNPQATWLDLSQNSGTGDATITATANSTNSSFNERSTLVLSSASSLPVNVDTLVVIQAGQQPQLSVNPSSLNLNFAAGSNDQLTVTANVSWTVSNPVTWLNLSTNSGSNNANITVSAITDNLSGSSRTANLTFSSPGLPDVMVMITQIDGTAPSFQVSRDTIFVDETAGSTANFSVLANAVDWSLSENIPWLVVNPARGNNTQLITLTAAGNNIFGNQRSGTIIASADGFSDTAITVIQRSSTPLFQTSPTVLILGSDAQDEVNFNISSNLISWKVEESSNWMTVSPDSGAFSSRITVRATETNNSGNVRTDMITVTAPPLVPQTIMVTQDTIRAIGLSENSVQESLEVFPNPSSGLLNITFESKTNQAVEYALFNSLGAQINAPEVLRLDKQIQLNLAALPAGFYFLNLRIDGKAYTRKIALINK